MTADVTIKRTALAAGGARPTAFGPLVAASDVELAVLDTLRIWLADYLAEVDRCQGDAVGTLPYPRGWVLSAGIEKMPEDQTPTIVVASPGLLVPPSADGRGAYTATWRVSVSAVVSARGGSQALRLARLYALAMRALLVQQQTLLAAVDVARIDWTGERYDELDTIDDRTICVGVVELAVGIADVLQRNQGPITPLLPPGSLGPDSPTWPVAEEVDVAIDKVPIEGDV